MLETIIGPTRDLPGVEALLESLTQQPWSGTLYIGYPVVALTDGPTVIDALLTCREHGVTVFDLYTPTIAATAEEIHTRQDELYRALSAALLTAGHLVVNRRLAVEINIVTVVPPGLVIPPSSDPALMPMLSTPEQILETLRGFSPVDAATLLRVNAGVQRIGAIRPTTKRTPAVKSDSRGAVLQRIEREIRNFDRWQKAAAIETPEGPQRIRGLAGSGKTVVLAHKAAYLHARRPEWRIALTFYTRTLYQQFCTLVERFYYEQMRETPNWSQLQILHAWGARDRAGVYRSVAEHLGIKPQNLRDAQEKYGQEVFSGICQEIVTEINRRGDAQPDALWDVILVDEAQDLPASFFEMVYLVTAPPKRVVWAYDELQNLGEYQMRSPSKLFGADALGQPRVPSLTNPPGSAKSDIILPKCYRNTPWALTVAHALGFGVYRDRGLVQFFDSTELWQDIGYDMVEGELSPGMSVTLERSAQASPTFFADWLTPDDAVRCEVFSTPEDQATWVAEQIRANLEVDELTARDVLIVIAPSIKFNENAMRVIRALNHQGITGHIVGLNTGPDTLFSEDSASVPIVGILRAKGNEAPMVYVLHSEYGAEPVELIRRRNTLFTAITRSKAWVRICGCGPGMEALKTEVAQVVAHGHKLKLTVPTPEQLRRIRQINRDMTNDQRALVHKGRQNVAALAELAGTDDGLLDAVFATLSPEDREKLIQALQAANNGGT